MSRLVEPSPESLRSQLRITAEDPKVFRPNQFLEALRVARIIRDDEQLPPRVRRLVEVGLVLDLMPMGLRPGRNLHAKKLGVTIRSIQRRELEWEAIDQQLRFDLARRAMRLILTMRAADI